MGGKIEGLFLKFSLEKNCGKEGDKWGPKSMRLSPCLDARNNSMGILNSDVWINSLILSKNQLLWKFTRVRN